jgi:hypothetical protein
MMDLLSQLILRRDSGRCTGSIFSMNQKFYLTLLLAAALAAGCTGDSGGGIDAAVADAAVIDAVVIDGDVAALGEVCGASALDAGTPVMCASQLACCYPCGIPGCSFTCTSPCDPDSDPGCVDGCMLVP